MDAVYGVHLEEPVLRFLLADDPGAGKTIMAGFYIKELMLRWAADRALIVTSASLRPQWQRELAERFGVHCIQLDASRSMGVRRRTPGTCMTSCLQDPSAELKAD